MPQFRYKEMVGLVLKEEFLKRFSSDSNIVEILASNHIDIYPIGVYNRDEIKKY